MDKITRSRIVTGLLLIALGLGLWGLKLADALGQSIVLMGLGGLFIAGYLYSRSYGKLVAGGIILGLGIGSFGERYQLLWGEYSEIGLGVGFLLVYVIALLYERRSHWWPLIPGTILLLLGLGRWNRVWTYLVSDGWPLLLVVVGIFFLLGALGHSRSKKAR